MTSAGRSPRKQEKRDPTQLDTVTARGDPDDWAGSGDLQHQSS